MGRIESLWRAARTSATGLRRLQVPFLLFLALSAATLHTACATDADRAGDRDRSADAIPTLGLEQGVQDLEAGPLRLKLVRASQTVAALQPVATIRSGDAGGFDFTPSDWLDRRAADEFFHLGDLTLRLRRAGSDGWKHYSTAAARRPVDALPAEAPVLAAADLTPTLPPDLPLRVHRYWESGGGRLALRFEVHNPGTASVEIGALGR